MRKQLLEVIFAVLAPASLQGQSVNPADLAGDWILAVELFGETNYQRMTWQVAGDHVTVVSRGLIWRLEGRIRYGKVELEQPGEDGPPTRVTGTVERGGMSGEFTNGTRAGRWKATRLPVRPPNAPREHAFEPKEFHHVFSGAIPPVLRIYPGDTVKTWSVDAAGVDAKGITRCSGNNPLTGPFAVLGALPGDTLVVKFKRIRPNRDTAVQGGRIMLNAVTPYYVANMKSVKNYKGDWVLDREKGVARLAQPTEALKDYTVPLRPILGCVGVGTERTVFDSRYPGRFGGNMDYNRLREGVTLYLPVYVPGALLFMGDGHAAQGDGEVAGSGLETSMDIEFTVDVIPGKFLEWPRAEDSEYLMAMGIEGSLTEAFQIATTEMARWLGETYKLNVAEVASVLGTAMQYDIAEVVDPYVNVVAKVPKRALAQIRKAGR
jgi:acetamidase/formamidase